MSKAFSSSIISTTTTAADANSSNNNATTTSTTTTTTTNDRIEWSRSTILDFIEDYHSQRVLWDPNTKGYHIKQTKYEALKALGTKYGTEIRSIRSKIKSLRSSFHREHGKVINGRRKGIHYQPMWFAYEAIRFILDGERSTPTLTHQQQHQLQKVVEESNVDEADGDDGDGDGDGDEEMETNITQTKTTTAIAKTTMKEEKLSNGNSRSCRSSGEAATSTSTVIDENVAESGEDLNAAAAVETTNERSVYLRRGGKSDKVNSGAAGTEDELKFETLLSIKPTTSKKAATAATTTTTTTAKALIMTTLPSSSAATLLRATTNSCGVRVVGAVGNENGIDGDTADVDADDENDNNIVARFAAAVAAVAAGAGLNVGGGVGGGVAGVRCISDEFAAAALAADVVHQSRSSSNNNNNNNLDNDGEYCTIRAEDVKTEIIESDMPDLAMCDRPLRAYLTPSPLNYFKPMEQQQQQLLQQPQQQHQQQQLLQTLTGSRKRKSYHLHHNTMNNDEAAMSAKRQQQQHQQQQQQLQLQQQYQQQYQQQLQQQLQLQQHSTSKQRELLSPATANNSTAALGTGTATISTATATNSNNHHQINTNNNTPPKSTQFTSSHHHHQHQANNDEYGVFGEYVAITIRKLKTSKAKIVVKHLINNLLYEAELGKYDHGIPASKEPPQLYKM